jgi:betaine-aldehyde dehydrogenase
MADHDKLYIGGEWVVPATGALIEVISPHTEAVIARVPEAAVEDVDRAVAAARTTFDAGVWSAAPAEERIAAVERCSNAYAARLADMATVITEEMGSPITFSNLGPAPATWMMLNTFLAIAKDFEWEEARTGAFGDVIVRHEPVGVVAAVVPWNVPQFVTMSKLAPALLAGCSIVIKPAPETPLDAYLMADALDEAGIPKGVVSIVAAGREVGEHLVRHPDVDKVAFTGSTAAGRRIAAICGEQLKRVSLELGGKSAAIVLDDADLEKTVEGLRFASLMNSGQACVAQTRILASERRYDEVVDAVAGMVRSLRVGDPSDAETEIGPLVAQRQQERVEKYIALGQEEGAKVVVGGSGRPDGLDRGWYVQPTVFAGATNDMRIAREEIFGPVLSVIPYADPDDAVRIANDSDYGLAGSVWTNDIDAGMDIARRVRTGTYAVNQYNMDFMAPFGGFKGSGIGREFGKEGLEHYTELKAIIPPGSGIAAAG